MRVIAGLFRSRILQAPAGLATRPTSDRLRETLFNVLAPHIQGANFLDLYAGSGAVGIEALSRGAASVVFVERAQAAIQVLRTNLDRLGLTEGYRIVSGNVGGYLHKTQGGPRFDVVFLDPPYDALSEYAATLELLGCAFVGALADGVMVIAEHRRKDVLEDRYGQFHRSRLLKQGDAALSFYARSTPLRKDLTTNEE
jgi:16S rRNA (guanine966-N2)-methyltransferase